MLHNALLSEMELRFKEKPFVLETVYFGGGTPSFVDPDIIVSLLDELKQRFGFDAVREITLEANPDDMTAEKLQAWKTAGITRLSVGIQSFYDDHLRWMNRAHTAAEAEAALGLASELGFELSLDLIFGIPGCSDAQWISNIEKACSFGIDHLSCYGLTLEERTPWKKMLERGKAPAPDENSSAAQFQLAMNLLREKGWIQYEISNYCRPGKMALHNTSYWQNKPYVGLGPSAHSFDGAVRSWNIADLDAYVKSIDRGVLPAESETLSLQNRHNEYVMTSLRTIWGCDLDKLAAFGLDSESQNAAMQRYMVSGHLQMEGTVVTLTDEGKMIADVIASELFV